MELSLTKHQATTTTATSGGTSSSSVIASNIDILRQILLPLPVKSLFVFKSVSKKWFSLISDPFFVRSHILRNHLSIAGLYLQIHLSIAGLYLQISTDMFHREEDFIFLEENVMGADDISIETPSFMNDPSIQFVHQSCNGLFLCSGFHNKLKKVDDLYGSNRKSYFVYNPSTKQRRTIINGPQDIVHGHTKSISSIGLAFDPLKSPHYEVVLIYRIGGFGKYTNRCPCQIEIYSSMTSSWRLSGDSFFASPDMFNGPGVFWNGSLHWISDEKDYSSHYFDIECESLKTLPMPTIPNGWYGRNTKYFQECRGHLFFVEIYDSSTTCFDVLEMGIDYTGWTVKYRVDLVELSVAYPEILQDNFLTSKFSEYFSILLVEEGEEKSSKLVFLIADKVVSYNPNKMSFKQIHDLSASFFDKNSFLSPPGVTAYQFIESLASV